MEGWRGSRIGRALRLGGRGKDRTLGLVLEGLALRMLRRWGGEAVGWRWVVSGVLHFVKVGDGGRRDAQE